MEACIPAFRRILPQEMRKLCEMADIITPNRTEARLLLGDAPDEEAVSNEELLAGLHNENVIITSVRRGDKIGYLARLGTEIVRIEKPMVHRQLHGTGDVFTSALCGRGAQRRQYQKRAACRGRLLRPQQFRILRNTSPHTGTGFALKRS